MAIKTVCRFYAELEDVTPRTWRRFEVDESISMARLGYILMTMFEMKASHLFRFEVHARTQMMEEFEANFGSDEVKHLTETGFFESIPSFYSIELPFEEELGDGEMLEEYEVQVLHSDKNRIRDIRIYQGKPFDFLYDYGDGWCVKLVLESEMRTTMSAKELPRVLEGEGFGIIEDCGGPGGLEELVKVFKRGKGKEYEEMREWLGRDTLDLHAFDIEDINFRLKKLPRIFKEAYENFLEPTQKSIDLLERKYLEK